LPLFRRVVLAATASVALASAWDAAADHASGCRFARIAEWPVRIERNHLITDGAINGKRVGVLLDTGAMQTLILRSAAERLGLTRWGVAGARMYGIGGESAVNRTLVDEFRVGQFARTNLQMIVAGERDFGADVLLGEDFFRQFDVEFDLAADSVRLYQPENCASTRLAYWAGADVGHVEFDPIHDGRPEIILTVEVNGQPIKALLDSGASGSILDKTEAARVGVAPDVPGVVAGPVRGGLGSSSIPSWIGPFKSFTIGNETIRDTEIVFADVFKGAAAKRIGSNIPVKAEGLPSMLLGYDFLRSHRVLIAHSQNRIYFTYNGGPVFARAPPPVRAAPGMEGE
jgi:clan AA aspartic protease (TIGR02281 family)